MFQFQKSLHTTVDIPLYYLRYRCFVWASQY